MGIFFTIFAMTNIITGIFVDEALQTGQNDCDEVIQERMRTRGIAVAQLAELFEETDTDQNGLLTVEELQSHLENEKVRAYLEAIGLTLYEVKGIFQLLDIDGDGSLSINEFISGMTKLLGNARSADLQMSMAENKRMMETLINVQEDQAERLSHEILHLHRDVGKLDALSTTISDSKGLMEAFAERIHTFDYSLKEGQNHLRDFTVRTDEMLRQMHAHLTVDSTDL